ncbi:hypothetical protein BKA65DRAFT_550485 [Rhexocercosporidium sp. MPI-PUGE-AT-0058]|nr:hypothetical protein BKA65DRAFT_550485 [Rhexocercosporidium sp. MPI-PUGE-AT-0058]
MQQLVFLLVTKLLSSLAIFSVTLVSAQSINGIPICAKECALKFIGSSNCPLTNQTCICNYLLFYDSCVENECNGTDSTSASEPPIPYYIPDATISIGIIPTCFPSTTSLSGPTASPIRSTSSVSDRNRPASTTPATTLLIPSGRETLPSKTVMADSTSMGLMAPPSRTSITEAQGNSTVQQSRTDEGGSTSASRSQVAQLTLTGSSGTSLVLAPRVAVVGLLALALGVCS